MFEKTLADLVRGIRNNKGNEIRFINQCLGEIKEELKNVSHVVKAQALQKLLYLKMLGFDITFSYFNAIEVMSTGKFPQKRIGYLASTICYHPTTEFVMLATNLFKKEFQNPNSYEIGLALNGVAAYCNMDLAVDIVSDIVGLLNHTNPYVRKKACLALYKVFIQYPDSLRPAFPRLKEKLEDSDPTVVACAVNVLCELAKKNPRNYLALAPIFFKILTGTTNNWMLIKVIKLLGVLTPLEPRLAKKLVEPLTNLMNSTTAMSLLYECINTCTIGLHQHIPTIRLCVEKLRIFVEDPDQNLKYLGLLGLTNVMKHHPKLISDYTNHVLQCLDDEDPTIRSQALDLLIGMATKKNLPDIVARVMQYMQQADEQQKDDLTSKVISLCRSENFQFISNFPWYLQLLVDLSAVSSSAHGNMIAEQFIDVTVRVKSVQEFSVNLMISLLKETRFFDNLRGEKSTTRNVLASAAWIVGEFPQFILNPSEVVELLLSPRVARLPGNIQSAYLNAALKVVVKRIEGKSGYEFSDLISVLSTSIDPFTKSFHTEVQERACIARNLISILSGPNGEQYASDIAYALNEELNPVAPKAQLKVPLPDGLDLDEWIHEPADSDDDEDIDAYYRGMEFDIFSPYASKSASRSKTGAQTDKQRSNDPFYIKASKEDSLDVDDIPVQTLTLDDVGERLSDYNFGNLSHHQTSKPLTAESLGFGREKDEKGKKGKKGKKEKSADDQIVVSTRYDMPEGAHISSDEEDKKSEVMDNTGGFDVDLTTPLGAHEVLPTIKPYVMQTAEAVKKQKKSELEANSKKDKKKSEKPIKSSKVFDDDEEEAPPKAEKSQKPSKKSALPSPTLSSSSQTSPSNPAVDPSGLAAPSSSSSKSQPLGFITSLITPTSSGSKQKKSSSSPAPAPPTKPVDVTLADFDSIFGGAPPAPKPSSKSKGAATPSVDDILMGFDPMYAGASKPSKAPAIQVPQTTEDILSFLASVKPVLNTDAQQPEKEKSKKKKKKSKEDSDEDEESVDERKKKHSSKTKASSSSRHKHEDKKPSKKEVFDEEEDVPKVREKSKSSSSLRVVVEEPKSKKVTKKYVEDSDEDDAEEDDYRPKSKSKSKFESALFEEPKTKSQTKMSKKSRNDSDDESEEEVKPKSKSTKSSSKSRKPRDESEEESEEEVKPKSKSTKSSSKSRKPRDESEEDSEEEVRTKSKTSSKSKARSKKAKDESDEESEEAPRPKSKSSSKSRPSKEAEKPERKSSSSRKPHSKSAPSVDLLLDL